jgi:hypothetical protein
MLRYIAIIAQILLLVGCSDPPTMPDPPPPPPPVDPPPPPPETDPRVDRYVDIHNVRGYSWFAGTLNTEDQMRGFAQSWLAAGYNTPRTCAEHETWGQFGLRQSYSATDPRQLENVQRYLDVTARIPGMYVKLMAICNMKENGRQFNVMVEWVDKLSKMIAENKYKHVWISVANEPWHPNSSLRDSLKVNTLIRTVRRHLDGRWHVTVDDNSSGPRDITYNRSYNSNFPEFHPWRVLGVNPWVRKVPNGADIRRMVERNGAPVIISEPIAYGAPEAPCCTTDEQLLINYKNAVERNDGIWFYHTRS